MVKDRLYADTRFGLTWRCLEASKDGAFKVQLAKEGGPVIEHRPSEKNVCTIGFVPLSENA